jgi:hypothetical protein
MFTFSCLGGSVGISCSFYYRSISSATMAWPSDFNCILLELLHLVMQANDPWFIPYQDESS